MLRFLLPALLALCAGFPCSLSAQSFSIAYQTPDALLVCGADTLRVTVQNNTATALTGVELQLTLPAGIEYVPGTVASAVELNVANLNVPVFAIEGTLAPNGSVQVTVQLRATCALVAAINNNQLFSVGIEARQGALVSAVTTTSFIVETPFVVITQVVGDSLSGEKDDVLTRTIYVKNTRLGTLTQLTFRDAHNAGIDCHVPGSAAETETPTLFTATLDGAFFAAFGDGDALFEFNEEIAIVEEVTITDCGTPQYFVESVLAAEWSCTPGDPVCQGDPDYAEIFIKTSTREPAVAFYPTYGLPWSYCGDEKTEMRVRMVNEGTLPAQNILLVFSSLDAEHLGIDSASFRLRAGTTVTHLNINAANEPAIDSCGVPGAPRFGNITLTIPQVPPGDTLDLIFDTYFCTTDSCQHPLPNIQFDYFYAKPCPPSQPFNNGTQFINAHPDLDLLGLITYQIGDCLEDGQLYNFAYQVQSDRLVQDTGFLWLTLDIPWGMFWQDCGPLALDGQQPALFSLDTLITYDTITRMRVAFALPLSTDSVGLGFCLRMECRDDGSYWPVPLSGAPGPNGVIEVFTPICTRCGYLLQSEILLTRSLDTAAFDCAVSTCNESLLRTECDCAFNDGGGPGGGGGDGCYVVRHHFSAARTNFDLADADNDRLADGTGEADPLTVRRDRFMPGDTLEAVAATRILCGDSIGQMFYQLFIETAESDIPYAGVNDFFSIGSGRNLLTKAARFRVYETLVTIWDSTSNSVYTCTMETEVKDDTLLGVVLPVNVIPQPVVDRFITMNHLANPNLGALAATGCVPPGFLLDSGDSIEVRVRYKLDFNFAPFSIQHWPPLINFEIGLNTGFLQEGYYYNYRQFDTLMLQYSGYRDTFGTNLFGIRPCQNSTEIRPFLYRIRLARENLFPFEVRPLSRLAEYSLGLPNQAITPLSATLKFLRLQENVPVFQNEPIGFSIQNNRLFLDFSPFYINPLDEGYSLETGIVFGPSCELTRPDSSRQTAVFDYFNCLKMPDSDTVSILNGLGYLANRARDTMTTNELLLEFPTANISVDVQVKNLAPIAAPNYWIRFDNPEGGLTNYSIVQLPGNTPIPATNGIFQLGALGANSFRDLRFFATNTSCDEQTLRILYGWNCDQYTDVALTPCEDDTLEIQIVPLLPELELDIELVPASIPLCDTSDYIIVALSNADFGYAYTPYLDLQLPNGIEFVPGSFGVSYPAGSAYAPLPDPTPLGNNTFAWQLDTVIPAISANGLPGVDQLLQNVVQVRFRVVAACGAVSNAQMIFGTGAKNSCGENANSLRKASPPLLIDGFAPAYGVQLGVAGASTTPPGCSEERELNFTLQAQGTPSAGDSLYISLPPGFSYVAGSYVPGPNAPAGPPIASGGQLQLPLPPGLTPNVVMSFTLRVQTPPTPLCTGAVLTVQARQRTTAFCELTGSVCDIYVATGEATFPFGAVEPLLEIQSATLDISNGGAVIGVSANFLNAGDVPIALSLVQWYRDVDGNGVLSAADTLVFELPYNQLIAPGGSAVLNQSGIPNPGPLCNLMLVVPALENCLCAPLSYPLSTGLTVANTTQACADAIVALGVAPMPGFTYAWSAGAPCTDCPGFDFSAPLPGMYGFTLTESGPGCSIMHTFNVDVTANPVLLSADTAICRGRSVTLATAGGSAWLWSPTGTGTPGPTLTVQPQATTTYGVTVTSAQQCTTQASVTVTVLDSSLTNLGTLRTCAGTPIDIFGTLTDVPGTYCETYPKENGCDSTLCLVLEVVPGSSEQAVRCPGQTIEVFGQPVTAPGTYCQAFPSSLGCDSIHCVIVTDLPPVILPFADTTLVVAPGVPITLPGLPGFVGYSWTPPTGLSCTDCPSPTLTPVDSTVYTVVLTTAQGCTDSALYRVLVLPPCDPARVEMPNAFTPNGDSYNDTFRPVVKEGVEVIHRLTIWDRWGEKIYEQTDPNAAWDGTYKGKVVPADTYLWIMDVNCSGELTQRRGDVTVLR